LGLPHGQFWLNRPASYGLLGKKPVSLLRSRLFCSPRYSRSNSAVDNRLNEISVSLTPLRSIGRIDPIRRVSIRRRAGENELFHDDEYYKRDIQAGILLTNLGYTGFADPETFCFKCASNSSAKGSALPDETAARKLSTCRNPECVRFAFRCFFEEARDPRLLRPWRKASLHADLHRTRVQEQDRHLPLRFTPPDYKLHRPVSYQI
jgi:hypothetical protein